MQTSYDIRAAKAIGGMIADMRTAKIGSYFNKHSAAVPFGIGMARGDAADRVILPVSAAAILVGVTGFTHSQPHYSLSNQDGIKKDGLCNILEEGVIWVRLDHELNIAHDDPVYMRITSDSAHNTQLGTFRNNDDTKKAILIRGARFKGTHVVGPDGKHLALVEFRGFHGKTADIDATIEALDARVETLEETIYPHVITPHVQVIADATALSYKVPTGKVANFVGATYFNETGLLEDATNYFVIAAKINAGDILASWSTQDDPAAEGTIAAGVAVDLTNQVDHDRDLVAGTQIDLDLDEQGSATLPAGMLLANFSLKDAP